MSDMTSTERAIREAAWQNALHLHTMWTDTLRQASGGPGGGGYRDPMARAEATRLRSLLDEVVTAHRFQGSRIDPTLGWVNRDQSWECPA